MRPRQACRRARPTGFAPRTSRWKRARSLNATKTASKRHYMRWLVTIMLAVIGGFAGAAAWDFSGLGGHATRDYLFAHPEVLPEAINRYQAQQRQARLAPVRDQ